MTATPTVRLEALEAEAFRAQHHQAQVAARLDHITNALGDLSQDGRGVALDVREIKTELTGVSTKLADIETDLVGVRTEVAEVKSEMRRGFAAILARLDALGGNG
jgi:chromosome segregation ATPase